MEKGNLKDYVELGSTIITFGLGFAAYLSNGVVKIVMLCLAVLCLCLLLGYLFYKLYRIRVSRNNNKIIMNSIRYINLLYKLLKANERSLKKVTSLNEIKRIESESKKLIKKVEKLKNSPDENLKKICANNKNIFDRLKNSDFAKTCEITNYIISKSIMIKRMFLQLNQYKKRMLFGEYIIKYASNTKDKATGYIDFIGWTDVLQGRNHEAIEAIKQGIITIDAELNDQSILDDERYDLILLKARAYRHLGTTYYTYKTLKGEVLDYLQKGKKLLTREDVVKYYEAHPDKNEKRIGMLSGIENNIQLYHYAIYRRERRSDYQSLVKIYDEVNIAIKEIIDNHLENDESHRLVKLYTLKDQILIELRRHSEQIDDKKLKEKIGKTSSELTKDNAKVTKILDKNIYFDDAIEMYVNNLFINIEMDIIDIINKPNNDENKDCKDNKKDNNDKNNK